MGKPNTPGCGSGAGCCAPVNCIIGTDSYDRADESPVTGWTIIDGDFAVSGNVLVPDTAGSNQKISWNADAFTGRVGVEVKIIGQTGDRVGVGLYTGSGDYIEFTVRFGSSNGRMNYNDIRASATYFTYGHALECIDEDINVPPNEWATLTVMWENGTGFCHSASGPGQFNAILETSAGTYLMAVEVPEPSPGANVILLTGTDSIVAGFNDFVIFYPNSPGYAYPECETIQHCCIGQPIAQEEGWTELVGGTFTLVDALVDYAYTDTLLARRTLDDTYWNDNLDIRLRVGLYSEADVYVVNPTGAWRLYFSMATGANFYAEMRIGRIEGDYNLATWNYRLYNGAGTLVAWMDLWGGGIGSGIGEDSYAARLEMFELNVQVWDCQIYWGFFGRDIMSDVPFGFIVEGGIVGGAEFGVGMVRGVSFCAGDSFNLNRSGEVGLGTGNETISHAMAFTLLSVECTSEFECIDDPPDTDPPDEDPDDPGDPSGCCVGSGFDDIEVGDAVEITVSSITYWFGVECAAGSGCDLTSSFLTALNATHSATIISRSGDGFTAFRRLTLTNPCDDCVSVDGAPLSIELMMRVYYDSDTGDCYLAGKITSNCGGCEMNYLAIFSPGADCTAVVANYLNPFPDPSPEKNCCIYGGSSTMSLTVV